jgi:hypothetical protein
LSDEILVHTQDLSINDYRKELPVWVNVENTKGRILIFFLKIVERKIKLKRFT